MTGAGSMGSPNFDIRSTSGGDVLGGTKNFGGASPSFAPNTQQIAILGLIAIGVAVVLTRGRK